MNRAQTQLPSLDHLEKGPFDLPILDSLHPHVNTREGRYPFKYNVGASEWFVRPVIAAIYGPDGRYREQDSMPPLDEALAITDQELEGLAEATAASVVSHSFGWLTIAQDPSLVLQAQVVATRIATTRHAEIDGLHLAALVDAIPAYSSSNTLSCEEWSDAELKWIDLRNGYRHDAKDYLDTPSKTGFKLGDMSHPRQTVATGNSAEDLGLVIVDIEPIIYPA